MGLRPAPLGSGTLEKEELMQDKKSCRRFGPCGVGRKALYLNSFYIDRRYYVPLSSVKRIYKRVAMSKGGFTGRGMFASIPYLVAVYDDGREKACNFKYEEQVDQLIAYVGEHCPGIKLVSEAAEERLRQKEEERAKRVLPELSESARRELQKLEAAQAYLGERPELSAELSRASKRKRTYDNSNPSYKWVALAIFLMGAAASVYGIYGLMNHMDFSMYFTLFGLAAIFLFSGANVLPTLKNNGRAIRAGVQAAQEEVERYLAGYEDFPLPARYAHPITVKWMAEAVRMGRAQNAEQAFVTVKEDLKRLNADVQVEQEEFDEIMEIKPMFLIYGYE